KFPDVFRSRPAVEVPALAAPLPPSRRCVAREGLWRLSPSPRLRGEGRGEGPLPESSRMTQRPLPLNDFLVLDLTAHRAGPTAVRQLADWGAQVIKIEAPGEAVDATGSRRDGPDFQNLHRNKRAMTLNLKSDEGRAIFFKLAERADVIVENYKS